jgi:hypothetical protein
MELAIANFNAFISTLIFLAGLKWIRISVIINAAFKNLKLFFAFLIK